jgi:hypothetical protein
MGGWMDGCMDGCMNGCMDGWMHGWMQFRNLSKEGLLGSDSVSMTMGTRDSNLILAPVGHILHSSTI